MGTPCSSKFDEEVHVVLERLAVQRMQHGMSGAVGGGAGAKRLLLAVMQRHAAKGALEQLAVFLAREREAEMFEFINRVRRGTAHIFDGVLIAEPIRPFDRVVHVPAPIVLAHIAERGRDAALRRHGMAASRKDFGDAGDFEALFRRFQGGAEPGATRADDDNVEIVIDDRISSHINVLRATS